MQQVPQGAATASSADQALYDAMARALLGEGPGAPTAEPEQQQLQLQRMLHYALGTQLRRHLER